MPLYDFVCSRCDQRFEELVRGAQDLGDLKCPGCGSEDVVRQLSLACVGATSGGHHAPEPASPGCGSCCSGGYCPH